MNILQLILIQIVTFVFIVLFLRWLLYNQIARAVKRLQKLNQQNMQKEMILKEEIERAKKEVDLEIKKSKVQAEEIKEEAREETERLREETIEKSRQEAKRIIGLAVKDIKRKQSEFVLEMESKAVHVAADMVRYIFTDKGLGNLHLKLIDELIEDIRDLDEGRIDTKTKEDKAEVISAHALQDKQKEKLKTALSSKLGTDITLTERLSPEVLAGLVVKMGSFIIDGSIENKLKKVVPMMKKKMREM